jgi:ribosomal protein S27E
MGEIEGQVRRVINPRQLQCVWCGALILWPFGGELVGLGGELVGLGGLPVASIGP